jgi:hypothetical protein
MVAGCGDSEGRVSLRGTVKLDGRPLANATVHFIAQDSEGTDALGTTDADGVFRLSTLKPGDGALPGKYKVVVRPPASEADTDVVATTSMEAMMATGRKPYRPSVIIPPRYSNPSQTILVQDVPASGKVVFELQSK